MNSPKNLIIALLSLLCCAEAVLLFRKETSADPKAVPGAADSPGAHAGPAQGPAAQSSGAGADKDASVPSAATSWSALSGGGDMHQLAMNLGRAGFPAPAIRAVIVALMEDKYAAKRAAIEGPYWKQFSTANSAEMTVLNDQMMGEIDDALGSYGKPSATLSDMQKQKRFGNLADAKIDAIDKIERDYSSIRKMAGPRSAMNMKEAQELSKRMESITAEMDADLAAILSSDELDQYKMHNPQYAGMLWSNLRNIDVSETEYAALYRMQKDFSGIYPKTLTSILIQGPEQLAEYDTRNDRVRQILGDDRFYGFLEAADPQYVRLSQMLADYPSVTKEATYEAAKAQRELDIASRSISANGSLTPEQRTDQLRAAALAAEARINGLLPPDAAAAFKRNSTSRFIGQGGTALPAIRIGG